MRRVRSAAFLCGLAVLLLLPTPASVAAQGSRYFPETNRTVENAFLDFWNVRGGLAIFGLPLSPVFLGEGEQVRQIFERAVFEWHPENDRMNRVQAFRLGDLLLDEVGGDDAQGMIRFTGVQYRAVPPRPCAATLPCETFAATRHTVQGAFLTFWRERGGLETFGYPLTEEFALGIFDGGRYAVQFFERARFEYHPEIGGGTVLISRLGALIWDRVKGNFTEADNGAYRVPEYTSTARFLRRQ